MTRIHTALALLIFALAAGCGSKDEDRNAADYAQRMAQEHRNDRPAASPAAQARAGAPTRSQTVRYASIGGQDVMGYLAYPAEAEGGLPGVLLFHEWWGLNDNIKSMADQLAAQGYAVLAADLYRGRAADRPEAARALMQETLKNKETLDSNLRQALAFLKEQIKATRIGTLGWCFGGTLSLNTALLLPDQVDVAVIYYGHVSGDPEQLRPLQAPVLGLFGGADPGIPVEQVRQFEATLKALGKPAEIHIYEGASHAFANPSGGNYKADAAADAWQKTLAFLAQHLKDG